MFHQVVVGRYFGRDNRLPFCQLFIHRFAEHVEDLVGLPRGGRVRAPHDTTQRNQVVVQTNREIEHILTALGLGLDKRFFHLGHLSIEPLAGIGNGLGARVALQALVNRMDLLAKIANLDDGIVRFRDLVTDLEKQIELLGQILLTDLQPRISFDLQRRSVTLA